MIFYAVARRSAIVGIAGAYSITPIAALVRITTLPVVFVAVVEYLLSTIRLMTYPSLLDNP